MSSAKPWGGRFDAATDRRVERFTASIDVDRQLAADDVLGSLAHARMLGETGIVPPAEAARLVEGLEAIAAEIAAGRFVLDPALEDVHMNVEAALARLAGPEIAGKLHTGRSRNDQVALDERLYLARELGLARAGLVALERALLALARAHVDTLLPGYTHLQRAQPTRLAHHLLAHREAFARDRGRVDDALRRAAVSPLGSGALTGTSFPIDRRRVAELLGLGGITANSIDGVSARDALLEAAAVASISMIHLSRLAEELVLWSTAEFGFVTIDDAFTTGSSMMPQKKNPDVAELVRGKCGRVIGGLVSLFVTTKALPLAYNRDLQEDKPALFDALSTWRSSLEVTAEMLPRVHVRADRMRAALAAGFVTATELADYLAARGVPFREAHHVVGGLVLRLVKSGRELDSLTEGELASVHPAFGPDALAWLDPERAIERRDLPGGPARRQVLAELDRAERELGGAP